MYGLVGFWCDYDFVPANIGPSSTPKTGSFKLPHTSLNKISCPNQYAIIFIEE